MEWHFDKDTVKILQYIYKHKGVTEGQIAAKFRKVDDVELLLIYLSIDLYLIATDEEGKPFTYNSDGEIWHSKNSTKWYTTAKSNVVVESENASLWKWIVPIIFSSLSLIISITNLLLKLFSI